MLIYLPETSFDEEDFLAKVSACLKKNCNVIVCVSEGIHDKNGTFICEYDSSVGTDTFGHKMPRRLRKVSGKPRSLPSGRQSPLCGVQCEPALLCFHALCHGPAGSRRCRSLRRTRQPCGERPEKWSPSTAWIPLTVPIRWNADSPDVNEVCNKEKTVPLSWISADGTDVTKDFIAYARPLIQGKVDVPLGEDGLPPLFPGNRTAFVI